MAGLLVSLRNGYQALFRRPDERPAKLPWIVAGAGTNVEWFLEKRTKNRRTKNQKEEGLALGSWFLDLCPR
jgi:hypothetical protein